MTTNAELLGAVTDLVPFLRWRIGAFDTEELLAAELIEDADRLAGEIMATAAGRGTDDPQVAASLWWQSYAYRVAGTTLACWLIGGAAPDPAAQGMAVGINRSRPSAVTWSADAATVDNLEELVSRLFDKHLGPMAISLRTRHALGASLVRGNVAAGIESVLAAVSGANGAPPLDERIAAVRAALPEGVRATVELLDGGYRRRTCCLWWKTTDGADKLCADCSLPARATG
jgi:ferric iron reductase protein FhuF